jgi:hypothetical protein
MFRPYYVESLPAAFDESLTYEEQLRRLALLIKEIKANLDNNLSKYIFDNLDKIMIEVLYDADAETILLKKEIKTSSETHSFDISEETIKIGG